MLMGIFLLLIGFVWLLSALGFVSAEISKAIWPIIFIAVGLVLILKKGHYFSSWHCGPKDDDKLEKK